MHFVWPEIWTFRIYVIWPVAVLLHVTLFIICVARTRTYLHSTIIRPVIGPYLHSTIIGPVIALLYGQTFGRLDFMSFGLSQHCCTIIGPVIALLRVSSGIIPVACTGLYVRSTIIWYLVHVPTVILWHMLGHIFVSQLYLSTRVHSLCSKWVSINP